MFTHKITKVEPLDDLKILATFNCGTKKLYDMHKTIERHEEFNDLINIKGLFEQVKVDCSGFGIVWNDYLDLASEYVWDNGYTWEDIPSEEPDSIDLQMIKELENDPKCHMF